MIDKTQQSWIRAFTMRLNILMVERDISGCQLAALTGFGESSIQGYRNGEHVPSAYAVAKIADALDCTTDDLITLKIDSFDLTGFGTEEIKKLRYLRDKYNVDEKLLIDAVRYMGPGLTKYEKIDQLLEMMSRKK